MVNCYLLDCSLNNLSLSQIFALSATVFGSRISWPGSPVQHGDHIAINFWERFLALEIQQPLCICSLCYISALATRHLVQPNLSFGWIRLLHQLDLIDHPVKWTWGGAILLTGGQQFRWAQPLRAGDVPDVFMWQKSLFTGLNSTVL